MTDQMSVIQRPDPASFRDPSGQVFVGDDYVCRTIDKSFIKVWSLVKESGFLSRAAEKKLLLEHEDIPPLGNSAASIKAVRLPFISYPYEWSFSQLKDAALLTLELLKCSESYGLMLKDATAYNVQFEGVRPVFIDHLSFEELEPGRPWVAYLQFCQHFLGPLALMHYCGHDCGRFSEFWINGIPLEVSSSLLPARTWLSPWLLIHIHLHRRMQKKHQDARKSAQAAKNIRLDPKAIQKLAESLAAAVEALSPPSFPTEWGDYYNDTNYSTEGNLDKSRIVEESARVHGGGLALDLGANTGMFSRLVSPYFRQVIAADIDRLAVDIHYRHLKKNGPDNILPLVLDLSNPSPPLGWGEEERASFSGRCHMDFMTALALIHHLVFTAGIPMYKIAEYFSKLLRPGGVLLLEFVPLEDSQVQRLLAARSNVFPDYNLQGCLDAFKGRFSLISRHEIKDSLRTMLVLERNDN